MHFRHLRSYYSIYNNLSIKLIVRFDLFYKSKKLLFEVYKTSSYLKWKFGGKEKTNKSHEYKPKPSYLKLKGTHRKKLLSENKLFIVYMLCKYKYSINLGVCNDRI